MPSLLANATRFDPSELYLIFILVSIGGIGIVCALAGLMLFLTRRAAHRHAELINTATMFWGLLAIGSVVYAAATQLMWSKQYAENLMSGNYDPSDMAPSLPWGLLGALMGIYLVLLLCTRWKKS